MSRDEEEIVQRARKGALRRRAVRSHVHAEGSGLSACDPDSRAVMKEVFGAAPGKGFIGGLLPDVFEELDCLAVGEDIAEAQEFPVAMKMARWIRPELW